MSSYYSCDLRAQSNGDLILNFNVNSTLWLWPTFNADNTIIVYTAYSDFEGYNYATSDKLAPVRNPNLLQYFLDNAADSIIDYPVYGSGIFFLPKS